MKMLQTWKCNGCGVAGDVRFDPTSTTPWHVAATILADHRRLRPDCKEAHHLMRTGLMPLPAPFDDTVQNARAATPAPTPTTLSGWKTLHGHHGRGPWRDVVVGKYEHWRCPCGDKFIAERAA